MFTEYSLNMNFFGFKNNGNNVTLLSAARKQQRVNFCRTVFCSLVVKICSYVSESVLHVVASSLFH
jgi:hypothetical protein